VSVRRYVFVIEQGLGHLVHGMNIERVLATRDDIDGTVIKLKPGDTEGVRPLPLVKNWSAQASWAAREVLRKHLAAEPVDAVFVHTQVAALMMQRIMHLVPTVVSLDATPVNFDTMAEAYRHNRQGGPIERFKFAVNRRALLGARAIVTWSPWAAESVVTDYGVPAHRVHAVYPGVDLRNFRPNEGPRKPGPVRILFVGGDFERKGGPDLITAASALGDAVEVDIVTGASHITVPPTLPVRIHSGVGANSSTMTELYRDADIFVLPTRGDCTPLAIAEALASGLPVVASTVGSIPDMIVHNKNGLLVPPDDPGRLAEALATLVAQPDVRRSMGAMSRTLAEQEHDTDANCHRLFELLDRSAEPAAEMRCLSSAPY
jgi:glycosyltransferase involved in cell wall biosynthesis